MRRFADRVVLVGAGGLGIGRACAKRFAAEGARTIVVDLDPAATDETVAEIKSAGGSCRGAVADLSDPEAIDRVVSETFQQDGSVDVLVNNAGILRPGSVLDQTVEEWDRSFDVNVRSMFLAVKAVAPRMVERGHGAIVNTGSTAGLVGEPEIAAYAASKGAVVNFTRQVAADLSRHGVRVNCVCPGWVPTGFNDPVLVGMSATEVDQMVASQVPVGRQGTPEEIAAAVLFLGSDEASFVTGQALAVDGGVSTCRI